MIPLRTGLLIGSHVVLAAVAGVGGWKLRDGDYQEHLKEDARADLKGAQEQVAQERKMEDVAFGVREELAVKETKRTSVTRELQKRIPEYVHEAPTVPSSGSSPGGLHGLDAGFVWLHNQAAKGTADALPASVDPQAPTGIGMPALADTLVHNYGVCLGFRDENTAWRDWYVQLRAMNPTEEAAPVDPSPIPPTEPPSKESE